MLSLPALVQLLPIGNYHCPNAAGDHLKHSFLAPNLTHETSTLKPRVNHMQVFHQLEQRRLVACERRAEVALRTLLLGEERSLGVFARNQDSIFEDAFEKVSIVCYASVHRGEANV